MLQHQIKVGDLVKIFGYAMGKSQGEETFALFEGEEGIVKAASNTLILVMLKDPEDIGLVEVHLYQVVPTKKDVLF